MTERPAEAPKIWMHKKHNTLRGFRVMPSKNFENAFLEIEFESISMIYNPLMDNGPIMRYGGKQ